MTALLGGFLGVAIILSLRRHALKLVEIAKYQELQKKGDIQDAVSNLNVLQCLGSVTRRFAGLNGRSPPQRGQELSVCLPACLTTYPRWGVTTIFIPKVIRFTTYPSGAL